MNFICEEELKEEEKNYKNSTLVNIKRLCLKNLATFEGRLKATRASLNFKSKIPIYINERIMLVPLSSYKDPKCLWLNYFEVKALYNHFCKSVIIFNNGERIEIAFSFYVVKKQLEKARKIDKFLRCDNLS